MFGVAQSSDRYLRILADAVPDTLAVAEEAKVIGTLGMMLDPPTDLGIAFLKRAILVPGGVNEGITSIGRRTLM